MAGAGVRGRGRGEGLACQPQGTSLALGTRPQKQAGQGCVGDDLNPQSASWNPTEAVAPGTGFSTNSSGVSAEARDGGHGARGP